MKLKLEKCDISYYKIDNLEQTHSSICCKHVRRIILCIYLNYNINDTWFLIFWYIGYRKLVFPIFTIKRWCSSIYYMPISNKIRCQREYLSSQIKNIKFFVLSSMCNLFKPFQMLLIYLSYMNQLSNHVLYILH